MIFISELFITKSVCASCVLLHGSAHVAPGEISALLAEAVIGSQGEDALHNLLSTALIAGLDSLFLKLPLAKKAALVSLVICLFACQQDISQTL